MSRDEDAIHIVERAFFIPIFMHLLQLWPMKGGWHQEQWKTRNSNNGQWKAANSNPEKQKAKQKSELENQNEQQKVKRVQMEIWL